MDEDAQKIQQAGYRVERGIPYGKDKENPRQQLDVYRPNKSSGELPVVVYFHGGGWEFGDKEGAFRRLQHFLDTGYVFVAVGYRLSSEATWPAPMDDAVAALNHVMKHLDGVDTERVALWGSSAGGHLASLLAGGCRAEQMPSVKCLVEYCAPITVNQYVKHLTGKAREESPVMKLFGGDHAETFAMAEEASVTNWVKQGYPSTLIVHGDKDAVVPIEQSEIMLGAVESVGSEVSLYVVKDSEHRVDDDGVRRAVKRFLVEKLEG